MKYEKATAEIVQFSFETFMGSSGEPTVLEMQAFLQNLGWDCRTVHYNSYQKKIFCDTVRQIPDCTIVHVPNGWSYP